MPRSDIPAAAPLSYDAVIDALGPMTDTQFAAEDSARAYANPAVHEAIEFRKRNPGVRLPPKGWVK